MFTTRAGVAVLAASLAAVVASPLGLPPDSSIFLRAIHSYTWAIGIAVVAISAVTKWIATGDCRQAVISSAWGFGLLSMTSFALSTVGDNVIAWATGNPAEAVPLAIALVLVKLTVSSGGTARGIAPAPSGVAIREERSQQLTKRDECVTAVHEAGHALVHAALDTVPDTFSAAIRTSADGTSVGHVTSPTDNMHLIKLRSFAEWQMHMLLAGMAAERALLASQGLGGTSDFRMWVSTASAYARSGSRGLYFSEPAGPDQLLINKQVLDQLKQEQEELLDMFFQMNLALLHELTDELLDKRELDAAQLQPFLARVTLPKGFPTASNALSYSDAAASLA